MTVVHGSTNPLDVDVEGELFQGMVTERNPFCIKVVFERQSPCAASSSRLVGPFR